jgi:hypothetical protein
MSSVRSKRQKKDVTTPVESPPAPFIATPYNMEKEAAPAPAEPPSGSDVARPINMEWATVAPKLLPVSVSAHAPNNARPPSPPPSPCTTPRDTCDCEDYLEENNQSIKVLVAMCIGLVEAQRRRH